MAGAQSRQNASISARFPLARGDALTTVGVLFVFILPRKLLQCKSQPPSWLDFAQENRCYDQHCRRPNGQADFRSDMLTAKSIL